MLFIKIINIREAAVLRDKGCSVVNTLGSQWVTEMGA